MKIILLLLMVVFFRVPSMGQQGVQELIASRDLFRDSVATLHLQLKVKEEGIIFKDDTLDVCRQMIKKLETKLSNSEEEQKVLKVKMADLEKKTNNNATTQKIKGLKKENKDLDEKLKEEQKKNKELQKIKNESEVTKRDLKKATEQNLKLRKQLELLEEKDTKIKMLSSVRDSLDKKSEEQAGEIKTLKEHIAEGSQELSRLNKGKITLESKIKILNTTVNSKEKEIKELKEEIRLLEVAKVQNKKLGDIFFPKLTKKANEILVQDINSNTELAVINTTKEQIKKTAELNNVGQLPAFEIQLNHHYELCEAMLNSYKLLKNNYIDKKVKGSLRALERVEGYCRTKQQQKKYNELLALMKGFCDANNQVLEAMENADLFGKDIGNIKFELNLGLKKTPQGYTYLRSELGRKEQEAIEGKKYKSPIRQITCN